MTALLDPVPVSRRGFLARSALCGVLLTLGGACSRGDDSYSALLDPDDRPVALPLREYAVLHAVARRMVPGGASHPGAEELHVAARVDREHLFHPPRLRDDLRDALRLIEWWPLLTRFSRFTRLDAAGQDAELAAMARSRFAARRTALQGVKFLVMFFHYTQDAAWQGTGYDGPWVPRVRPEALA